MSGERMTTIVLPGLAVGSGLQEYGRQSVENMINRLREKARRNLLAAEAILAAEDEDFLVFTHNGVHIWRNVEVLQEGKE